MARPRLFISRDLSLDYLSALEFGRVPDRQPDAAWQVIEERVGFLTETPGSRIVGFRVNEFSAFDPSAPGFEALWDGALTFDAPLLGLFDATAAEICLVAAADFAHEPTLNRYYFDAAVAAAGDLDEAAELWRLCLESGEPMAHYGLGYTLYGLADFPGAHRHLKAYTEINPNDAWAWCWLGKTCAALGQESEAQAAYERAIDLETDDEETDAIELLDQLMDERMQNG